MRLAITGKTESGKSTALHLMLSHLLRHEWAGILLFDGKGGELVAYQHLVTDYAGPSEIDRWATLLEEQAAGMAKRYAKMVAAGNRRFTQEDDRYLIVIDEVQMGTRHSDEGKAIKESLTLITEQSAALGDVVLMTTQRETNAIPPSARHNVNVWLRMLGAGYFYLQPDGYDTTAARTTYTTPQEALAIIEANADPCTISLGNLPTMLGVQPIVPGRAPVTIYMGVPGSGKTHALRTHPQKSVRAIELDLSEPHKAFLERLIQRAGASIPPRTTIPDLVQIARLATRAEPTLLLLDNLEQATDKMLPSLERLIQVAEEVAISCTEPKTPAQRRKIEPFISRARRLDLKPLRRPEAIALLYVHLPEDVEDMVATENRILKLAQGHPKTIVQLATQTQRGSLEEVRHYEAPITHSPLNIGWIALLPILLLLLLWRADGYMATAIIALAIVIVRRWATSGMPTLRR